MLSLFVRAWSSQLIPRARKAQAFRGISVDFHMASASSSSATDSADQLHHNNVSSNHDRVHLVGFHVSAAGGCSNAVIRAHKCGATAMAFFTRSNQRWECPPLKPDDVEKFKSLCKEHGYGPESILPHGSYLTNMGSPDPAMRDKSIKAIVDEVQRCKDLGIAMYNFHPGAAAAGSSREDAIRHVSDGINAVHAAVPGVTLVIENMAGQGSVLGVDLHEIKAMIDGVKDKSRVGVCIDTAHAHGAGIDVRTPAALEALLAQFHSVIGLQHLRGMHLNDSRALLGSRRDLHQNIGRGHIGLECFRWIMNEKRLAGIPLILETPCPNGDDMQIYADEIKLLYSLQGTKEGDAALLPELATPTARKAAGGATKSFKFNMDEAGKMPRPVGSGAKAKKGKKGKGAEEEDMEEEEDNDEDEGTGAGAGAIIGAGASSSFPAGGNTQDPGRGMDEDAMEPGAGASSAAPSKKRARGGGGGRKKAAGPTTDDAEGASSGAGASAHATEPTAPRPKKRPAKASKDAAAAQMSAAAASSAVVEPVLDSAEASSEQPVPTDAGAGSTASVAANTASVPKPAKKRAPKKASAAAEAAPEEN